ncbi:hypothetical protein [Streptomyces cyaneofuscatus]|uniref:hypothetical protein n=1 Tax=Streptomyces cyaneofuscatus TaxID=66883 RepID=UPI0036DD6671
MAGEQAQAGTYGSQGLADVLVQVTKTRQTRNGKERIANNPVTVAFLEAGVRLIIEQMRSPLRGHVDSEEVDARDFFSWLSKAKVLAEAQRVDGHSMPTQAMFRDRWNFQELYVEDLLSYSLWKTHEALETGRDKATLELLASKKDFAGAVQEAAYRDLCDVIDNPVSRIGIMACLMADRDEVAREAVKRIYEHGFLVWTRNYLSTLQARNIKLRDGVTAEELARMLTALSEGVLLQYMADPDAPLIDHGKGESILGKAANLIVASALDSGDGMSVAELVNSLGARN